MRIKISLKKGIKRGSENKMVIECEDHGDLLRKGRDYFNKRGFHMEIIDSFCDLKDEWLQLYGEAKMKGYAPAQALYGLGQEKIKSVRLIALINPSETRIYNAPNFSEILKFAKEIDPRLEEAPSSVNTLENTEKAFKLLGKQGKHITHIYDGGVINLKNEYCFVNAKNVEQVSELFDKYNIDIYEWIAFCIGVWENKQVISVTDSGYILNETTSEFFENKPNDSQKRLDSKGHKKIQDMDKSFYSSLRVKNEDLPSIRQRLNQLETIKERRNRGRYYTKSEVSKVVTEIVKEIDPSFIIEPYVGNGSLIESLREYHGVGNDIRRDIIHTMIDNYGPKWRFTSLDTIVIPYETLIKKWKIKKDERKLLILTNPPFGTVSTSKLSSKSTKRLLKQGKEPDLTGKSRKIEINYGTVVDKYGKGDLVIPAVGKLIDFMRGYKSGYLAFFCPMAVFCGRNRHHKLFKALLKDFEFIKGHIFSGKNFEDVTKGKPIAFTVWKYHENTNTSIDRMLFDYEGKEIILKPVPLVKDGWFYNKIRNKEEIGIYESVSFSAPTDKMIKLIPGNKGGQLLSENVKKHLGLEIPSELFYGLWSITVGNRTIGDCPVYIDNAYIHYPDFSKEETMEILAYKVIHTLLSEIRKDFRYTHGSVGFKRSDRYFVFGNEKLTEGAQYLINTYSNCPIGNETIGSVFNKLKKEPDKTKIPFTNYLRQIKKEIQDRLDEVGYWDYIPIPEGIFRYEKLISDSKKQTGFIQGKL